jgi:hypothetical protein
MLMYSRKGARRSRRATGGEATRGVTIDAVRFARSSGARSPDFVSIVLRTGYGAEQRV